MTTKNQALTTLRIFLLTFFLTLTSLSSNAQNEEEMESITGKIAEISNPCLDSPCIPGIVYALKNDTANFIISINNSWKWVNGPLIIDDVNLELNDSIKITGVINTNKDLQNQNFYEIELDTYSIITTISKLKEDALQVYYNHLDKSIYINSAQSNINNIEIYTTLGKLISHLNYNYPAQSTSIHNLRYKGIVILKIDLENKKILTKKVLIN